MITNRRVRVGYVGVAFGSYYADEHDQYGRAMRGLRALAEEMNFDLVAIDTGVPDLETAHRVSARLSAEQIDFLLLQTAACASGELLEPLAEVAPRLGIWATPEPVLEGSIQLHSLVSANHYASIIRRHLSEKKIPYKWFYGHIDEPDTDRRLRVTIRALQGIKAMASARIGWIGGISPGFYNMNFDEDCLKDRFGVTIGAHSIAEVVDLARSIDARSAESIVRTATDLATEVTAGSMGMDRNARVYLALGELIKREGYDALAVQCWPTFQEEYHMAPCMAYSLLGSEDGFAVSCEGDVPGAVTMLLMNSMSKIHGSSTLLDLTALDHASDAALFWHCGVTPRHFGGDNGIRWVDHVTLGRKSDITYGVSGDLRFAPQKTTIAYAGDDFTEMFIATADVVETGNAGFEGTRGWFSNFRLSGEPIGLDDLVNTAVVQGHEHHFAVAQGDLSSELAEVAAWLGMRTTRPVPLRDYLQIDGLNA
ncbi:MAG: hypothetical protein F4Z79_07325 [Acidimicrobiia bacterium]|nr:hypothetical protein [Acidimicrobiia bacterium]